MIIQFLDIFNEIRIARYESDGATVRGYLKVPLKFAPKAKTWYWIHERKYDEILPIMSATMQSCEFAADRVVNKDAKIIKTTGGSSVSRFLNPVPYNFGFQLSIWALFMVDIDQILEQILPFFEPQAFTQINIPELDATVDVKVVFQSCTPDVNFEMDDVSRRVLLWNLDFAVQGYIFRPITDSGIAEEIIINYYTDDEAFDNRSSLSVLTLGEPVSGASETQYLSGGGYDVDGELLYDYEVFSEQ
jgi:hypothetical protein